MTHTGLSSYRFRSVVSPLLIEAVPPVLLRKLRLGWDPASVGLGAVFGPRMVCFSSSAVCVPWPRRLVPGCGSHGHRRVLAAMAVSSARSSLSGQPWSGPCCKEMRRSVSLWPLLWVTPVFLTASPLL